MLSALRSLPVLMYHSISGRKSRNAVAPEIFAEQCRTLSRAGWCSLSLAEAEEYFLDRGRLPRKSCLITFDDGYLDNCLVAAPILRQYGMRGVIFPVLTLLEKDSPPRTPEDAASLHNPALTFRKGQRVRAERFCSVEEIRVLTAGGELSPAPHSLRHDRVAAGPEFTTVFRPGRERGYFTMPAYGMIWGMPNFPLHHALTTRAFRPSPRLVRLVRGAVPQQWKEAHAYLSRESNREALLRSIRVLEKQGELGRMESPEEYRGRLSREFQSCRRRFQRLFGLAPRSFCWPWGDYNAIALEEAQRAGFRLFFTTSVGANARGQALGVHRFKVSSGVTGTRLAWLMRLMASRPLAWAAGEWIRKHQG